MILNTFDKLLLSAKNCPYALQQIRKMKIVFDKSLKGLKVLNRDLFKIETSLPALKVEKIKYTEIKSLLKEYTVELSINKRLYDLDIDDPLHTTHKLIIFDSDLFDTPEQTLTEDLIEQLETKHNLNFKVHFLRLNVQLNYDNFKFDDIVKAILPDNLIEDNLSVKGFSVIGHIAHFNFRNELNDYKKIIAEILLDKIKQIKTVVNKVNEIDNTYRNFNLEILAGEPNTLVKCKENSCEFIFDFAHVYWNPRLCTEHERIISLFKQGDIIYDVFAGVGPFSVPAAVRKFCIVVANDLNPNSYKYLLENYNNNKSKKSASKNSLYTKFDQFQAYNLDGNVFIREPLKEHLFKIIEFFQENKLDFSSKLYVVMNLPAMAIEFLQTFNNLFTCDESNLLRTFNDQGDLKSRFNLNFICYTFCRNNADIEVLKDRIANQIFHTKLDISMRFVRKVAPSKEMYCVQFELDLLNLLFADVRDNAIPSKKAKLDN